MDNPFHRGVAKLLAEIFNGPVGQEAYILNPGDPGLLAQLDTVSASVASKRPATGRPTIAAHTDHIHYGISLVNRWSAGEEDPWAAADWNASWQSNEVSDAQWQALRQKLREASETLRKDAEKREAWDDLSATGIQAIVAHTAYHLGAIRQTLASVR